jgi:hypothetical protein
MKRLAPTLLLVLAFMAGCAADRPPEEITDDGLARVPSRSHGGVYRLPHASFVQYRRVILEPPSIGFIKDWRDDHPEVSQALFERIRSEAVQLFREEFSRELVTQGSYTFAEDPAPDVLLVIPSIEDLNIVAPDAGDEAGRTTYTRSPVSMTIKGDLRDAVTNELVGRVIMFEKSVRSGFSENEMRIANRVTNAHEQRLAYSKWARLVREAIDVAKAERPRPRIPAENASPQDPGFDIGR